jgi:hypothetical protein
MPRRNALLYVLPVALTLAGLAVVAATPFAWGAADYVGLASWMPSFTALAFGLPPVATGIIVWRTMAPKLRSDFSLYKYQLLSAVTIWSIAIVGFWIMATRIPRSSSYENLVDENRAAEGLGTISGELYVVVVIATGFVLAVLVAVAGLLYVNAITTHRKRREDEVDAVGEILRARHNPSTKGL